MSKVVIHDCTVEFTMPSVDVSMIGSIKHPAVKMRAKDYVSDFVIRDANSGKTIKIKRILIELSGKMMPVLDEQGNAVLFTAEDGDQPSSVEWKE